MSPSADTKSTPKRKAPLPGWMRTIITISEYIYPSCFWASGLALLAILTMLFLGKTASTPGSEWLGTALTAYIFCSCMGFLTCLIALFETFTPGWVTTILGAVLYFGGSAVISFVVGRHTFSGEGANFVKDLYTAVQNVGVSLMIMGMVRLMIGYTIQLMEAQSAGAAVRRRYANLPKGKGAQTKIERPSFIPKCWQMSRCRPAVRMSCPNYTDHVTCWKRRSGCFCDRDLANYLMSSVERGASDEIIEMQNASNAMASSETDKHAMESKMRSGARRPWRQQKKLCHACPLFIEHQEYKYKNFHWLSVPTTIAIMVGGFPIFHDGYQLMAKFLDEFAKEIIKRGGLPDNFNPDASGLLHSPFEYVLLVAVALILGSYIVNIVDKLFLEWKM